MISISDGTRCINEVILILPVSH